MVTFRFYVVSTVAFFLALAVGVVLGSVLDSQIADSLQDRLERVEASLDETVALIDDKNLEIERHERYIEASAPFVVEGRLEETSTLVVSESGVDQAVLDALVRRLGEAGSAVEGVVWLDPRWEGGESDDREALAGAVGATNEDPAANRAEAWRQVLAAAGIDAAGPDDGTDGSADDGTDGTDDGADDGAEGTTTTVTGAPPDDAGPSGDAEGAPGDPVAAEPLFTRPPLASLAEAGLVRLQTSNGTEDRVGGPLRVVAVTSTSSSFSDPGAVLADLVELSSAAGVPTVLAEAAVPEGEEVDVARGGLLDLELEGDPASLSTVDDLDLIAGRVATVLALDELESGPGGRYGYGPDVDGVLPRWQGP